VILPDNGRPVMTEEEIRAEREQISRQSMIGFDVGAAVKIAAEADDDVAAAGG
jgi:hypothetical protein